VTTPPSAIPAVHLDLDSAWSPDALNLPRIDLASWGPRLRYLAPPAEVESFYQHISPQLSRFTLYGSGDFHYLAALFLRAAIEREKLSSGVHLLSFDNHPDWDRRPPRWACGGWLNRALELPALRHERAISVWGCGNFELNFPSRLFRNKSALNSGKLAVFPWQERISKSAHKLFGSICRNSWRESFSTFIQGLAYEHAKVYVTIDLDCLSSDHITTNWETGLFTPADLTWALHELRSRVDIFAVDICGAFSPPAYSRPAQRFAAWWDHPKLRPPDPTTARAQNESTLQTIWSALTSPLN
jgi:hypothetical protein